MISEFDTYQNEAMVFRKDTAGYYYALLNMAAEVGELLGKEAKSMRDGYKPDRQAMKKELGDILWHVAAVAADYNLSLSNVAWTNIEKLADRQKRNVIEGSGDER